MFRDRNELQAGADLTATVREALAASRYLIVMCSPGAARSEWVNREILEFKRMHGDRRVLALIVEGEPFAARMPGREAEECLPSALRFSLAADGSVGREPLEPVAADLRGAPGAELEQYLAHVRGLESSGIQLSSLYAQIVAEAERLAGDAWQRAGQHEDAHARWTKAADRLQPEAAGRNFSALVPLGRARLRLGDSAAAEQLLARATASRYRHPDYADFVNELAVNRQ